MRIIFDCGDLGTLIWELPPETATVIAGYLAENPHRSIAELYVTYGIIFGGGLFDHLRIIEQIIVGGTKNLSRDTHKLQTTVPGFVPADAASQLNAALLA